MESEGREARREGAEGEEVWCWEWEWEGKV